MSLRDESNVGERKPLPRDESRFRYFYPNGKPVLPPNAEGPLSVKTTYERVIEAQAEAAK
jgi:hypothetical protein